MSEWKQYAEPDIENQPDEIPEPAWKQFAEPEGVLAPTGGSDPRPDRKAPVDDSPGRYVDDEEKDWADQAADAIRSGVNSVAQGIGSASKFVDDYTMAPVRSMVGNYMDGSNKEDMKLSNPEYDPNTAPSYKDLYQKAGMSGEATINSPIYLNPFEPKENKLSPAGIAGGLTGAVLDPLNAVPGGGLGKIGKIAGSTASRSSKLLRTLAEKRAAKAALGNKVANFRKVAGVTSKGIPDIERGRAKIQEFGRTLLDNKDIPLFGTTESIGENTAKSYRRVADDFGQVGKAVDDAVPDGAVNSKRIGDRILNYASEIPETEGGKALQEYLLKEAENLGKKNRLKFSDAQKFKGQFQFNPQSSDAFISNKDAVNRVNRIISDEMDIAAKAVSEGNYGEGIKQTTGQYPKLEKEYGTYKNAAESAQSEDLYNLSKRAASPTDYLSGAGGAGLGAMAGGTEGAMIGAFLAGAANNQVRRRGSSFVARTADTMQKVMSKSPAKFGKWYKKLGIAGAAPYSTIVINHHLLMNNDPEYRAAFSEEQP